MRPISERSFQISPIPRAAAVAALFALDRATKYWALHALKPRFSIPVLPFFYLTYLENTGMAFSVGPRHNSFFLVISATLIGILLYLQKAWTQKNLWVQMGLLAVLSGALGNLYDRICYGHVIDFLDFRLWPVFNVADSCVTIGAVCLGLGMYLGEY